MDQPDTSSFGPAPQAPARAWWQWLGLGGLVLLPLGIIGLAVAAWMMNQNDAYEESVPRKEVDDSSKGKAEEANEAEPTQTEKVKADVKPPEKEEQPEIKEII